jgi:hypothetical protein
MNAMSNGFVDGAASGFPQFQTVFWNDLSYDLFCISWQSLALKQCLKDVLAPTVSVFLKPHGGQDVDCGA